MASQLSILDTNVPHKFVEPSKQINEGQDVARFLVSKAYKDITLFLVQLNRAMFPRKGVSESTTHIPVSPTVLRLQNLLKALDELVDTVPLDPGTHRFGNTAFRKWHQLLGEKGIELIHDHLPISIVEFSHESETTSIQELKAYLLGSFGSSQRIDYGTGHELSFLAFVAGIWKLGGFDQSNSAGEEQSIVLNVINPYLILVRKLILKYSLEPAGSHGVWGLDDHFFLSYIFGSAQYGPAITDADATPVEGSSPGTPDPSSIVKTDVVARERDINLYFGAIGFIYDVKTGPFWEHSPTLFDISGVRAGWAKINKGMLKMYNAEVLSKFPVVQHFPFGSLFSFEKDPDAQEPTLSTHIVNQPRQEIPAQSNPGSVPSTAAPWAKNSSNTTSMPATVALPNRSAGNNISRRPNLGETRLPASSSNASAFVPTKAPWAKKT